MYSATHQANPSPRRRQRLSASPTSSSAAPATKRPKLVNAAMASAKARGKLPDLIDLGEKPSAFQPHSGAKKLVIKNVRSQGDRDAQTRQYYARVEKDLEDGLVAVFAGRRPNLPLEKLYRGVEDVCRNGNAEKVYRMLIKRVEKHLHAAVLPSIENAGGTAPEIGVLRNVLAEWKTWNTQTVLIRSIFSYLDRTYLLRESLPSINDMAISHFRRMLFGSQTSSQTQDNRIIGGICGLVDQDRRDNPAMDGELLRDSIMMLYVQGVYTKYLEPALVRSSERYFYECGTSWSTASLKEYISACESLLAREVSRCIAYNLDSTTERLLMEKAHRILISDYSDKLLNEGSLTHLLRDKDMKSMKGLYDLLKLSGLQKRLKVPWADYIRKTGAAIISDKENDDKMVIRLLELRRSLDLLIRDAFAKDEVFLWGMREAFGNFMNDSTPAACWDTGTSKIGEMTAKHIDMLLRGGLKTLPASLISDAQDRAAAERKGQSSTGDEDAELDRQLDNSLELFRFIQGKDTFEAFYKKDLARRLLMGRSASQDAERNMLTKLRGECGSNFTHNLEQMFKDQELAKDEMEGLKQHCENTSAETRRPRVDLQVMVLSAAAWPTYADVRLNLPDDVARQIERFDKHYSNKHTGRVLTWKHSLAHCSVKATFPRGAKELLVSAFQAVVLLMFNGIDVGDALSYEQLSAGTGLVGEELERTLQSLACGRVRVLAKHPRGREVARTDTFTVNAGFTDPKYRIKINQIQLRETKEESRATNERVEQDRRFETQAAIVRIMKSRKKMGHADLVAEVISLTRKRGSVEPVAIKKEIESLIEKDYLDREGNAYVYMA